MFRDFVRKILDAKMKSIAFTTSLGRLPRCLETPHAAHAVSKSGWGCVLVFGECVNSSGNDGPVPSMGFITELRGFGLRSCDPELVKMTSR